MALRLVTIVDNFHYHSCKQASKSRVGREREGSKYGSHSNYYHGNYATIFTSHNTIIIMAESNILGNTIHTVSIDDKQTKSYVLYKK